VTEIVIASRVAIGFGRFGWGRMLTRNYAKIACAAVVWSVLSWALCPDAALAGGGRRNVLLVINTLSQDSQNIGSHYQRARGIPPTNVCRITCSTAELVSKQEVEQNIREPIRQFIISHGLQNTIDYIVLTKGIPLAADYGDASGYYAVTSILTCVSQPSRQTYFVNPYGPTALSPPETAWSHQLFDLYLVTRLDGYSAQLVKAMIDRGLSPALDGKFVLDGKTGTKYTYATMNNRLGQAASLLAQQGFDTFYDNTNLFVGGMCGLMGYYSWGSNDSSYTWPVYTSNIFVPGGIADSYVSTSARTFNVPANWPNYGGQSLMADLLLTGLCGAGGYVSEPGGTTTTYATTLFDRYTKGYNLAESFYAACPELIWKTTIVGDPLTSPFSSPPIVALTNPGATITCTATIEAEAIDEGPIAKVDFFFDDRLIGSDSTAPYAVSLDTRQYNVGVHTVEAIAYENPPVATQGTATTNVYVSNLVSNCSNISQALQYTDGQQVRLTGKVAISATGSIPGAFYIEEPNRSAGIRVSDTGISVAEGNVIEVLGPVVVVNGEKTIVSPTVTITGTSTPPAPVTMSLATLCEGAKDTTGRKGIRTVALPVKVVGRVVAIDGEGALLDNGAGGPIVRMKCAQKMQVALDQWVLVAGICSVANGSTGIGGVILVERPSDVTVIQ